MDEQVVGQIGRGLLVFLGVEQQDDCTQADWLVGPGNYSVGEHEGYAARLIGTDSPIVEFLLEQNDDEHHIRYGVIKNAFVPVDNYRAQVTVTAADDGCTITFESTFELDEVPYEQVNQMLSAAYQMMGGQIDAYLNQA